MERGNEWSKRVARGVGERVAHYRKRADLTAAMLSGRCADLGLPVDRNVIAKLENGHRNSVTVDEVYVLAAALSVPPVQLLFAVGTAEEGAEILPGRHVAAFRAAQWVSGEGPLPGPSDEGVVTIADVHDDSPARPLVIYRLADEAFTDEMRAESRARVAENSGHPARADGWREAAERSRQAREGLRRLAASEKIAPPPAEMSIRPPGDALIV